MAKSIVGRTVVVDAGGTTTRAGVLSPDGVLSGVESAPSPSARTMPHESLTERQAGLLDLIASLCQRHAPMDAIGVSLGAVVTNDGIVENASILWGEPARGFDFAGALRARLPDVPVTVINDVSAAAWRYCHEKRYLLVTVSTGVGAKVFDDRIDTWPRLALDDAGLGGEMGHVVVDPSAVERAVARSGLDAASLGAAALRGDADVLRLLAEEGVPYCECGTLADLCSYTSGPAVARMAGRDEAWIAAHANEPSVRELLDRATSWLALRILQLCADLGLDKVFVTGGFANGIGEPYFAALRANLVRHHRRAGYFTSWSDDDVRALVRPCPDHRDDALIGAGLYVQSRPVAAIVKPARESAVVLTHRPRPRCGAEQVVARIRYAGICATDLQILRGERRCEPGVLGHECVAEALEVGEAVRGLAPGDLFAINPNNPFDDHDKIGHTREGIFQELFVFHDDLLARGQIVPLSPPARPEQVLLELLACVLHAQARVEIAGRDVLVAGAGIAGQLHAMAARRAGAKSVAIANRSPRHVEGLLLFDDELPQADVVIIAGGGNGGPAILERVLPSAREGATVVLFGGFLDDSRFASIRAGTPERMGGVTLAGSRGSRREDYLHARDLELDLRPLVGRVISFREAPAVLNQLRTPPLRVVIDFSR